MERRESLKNPNDEARKETTKTPRSRQEDSSSFETVRERENPDNQKEGHRTTRPRDRRNSKGSRSSNRRTSSRGENRESRRKVTSGSAGKKKNNRKLMGLSDTSMNAIGKRASRRLTRASIHSPSKNKSSEEVPTIPKRVFKALHLLRHEKFLRVVSRYLKPRVKGHKTMITKPLK